MASNVMYVLIGIVLVAVVVLGVFQMNYENNIENAMREFTSKITSQQLVQPTISFNFPYTSLSYPVNSTATITVMDENVNSDKSKRAHITVNVTSTSDSHGILLTLYQKPNGSSEFVTAPFKIVLTSLDTDNSVKWLHVESGDTLFVTYKGQTTTAAISPAISLPKVITRGIPLGSTTTIYGDSPDQINSTQYPIDRSTVPSCISDYNNDGICGDWIDGTWGTPGQLSIPYGNVIYQLPCTPGANDAYGVPDCPDINSGKDIYVEIQYMSNPYAKDNNGNPTPISQAPSKAALTAVAQAFLKNPTGTPIRVHFQVDNSLDRPSSSPCGQTNPPECHIYYDLTTVPGAITDAPGTPSFFSIKNSYFGTMGDRSCTTDPNNYFIPPCGNPALGTTTSGNIHDWLSAKREAFHYALFIHSQKGATVMGSSGWGEIWGNDIVISLGAFANGVGNDQEVEGTLMHELGHNLNLDHGGPVNTGTGPIPGPFTQDYGHNCKPNQIGVMNYLYQFPYFTYSWNLGYFHSGTVTLDENSPDEQAMGYGIGSNTIVFGGNGVPPATGPNQGSNTIDWDRDGVGLPYKATNIDNVGIPDCQDNTLEKLYSYDDWSNLNLYFWDSYNYASAESANPEASHPDMSYRDVTQLASNMYSCPEVGILSSIDPGTDIGKLLMTNHCLLRGGTITPPPSSLPGGSYVPFGVKAQ